MLIWTVSLDAFRLGVRSFFSDGKSAAEVTLLIKKYNENDVSQLERARSHLVEIIVSR